MKLFAITCMCIAAYLFYPLPQRREAKVSNSEVLDKKESQAKLATNSEILDALGIIRLGLNSGMTISDALEFARQRSTISVTQEIERGLNQFRIGLPLVRGLEEMATINPSWRSISDTLITSINSGGPISDQLADVEFLMQSYLDTERLKRIKSVAVKSVLPLGVCFLPAFMLLAIVPIVAGLIGGITQ